MARPCCIPPSASVCCRGRRWNKPCRTPVHGERMDYNLIVPYIPNLRRYARALVGDRDGADDLVQDTLERAVRKFHLWRPGDLRAWLFSIMHNVFVNQLKSRKIAADVEIDDTFAAPVSSVTRTDVMDLQ